MKLDQVHVEWSRRHFNMLAEGGTWGVPRSGLIYVKRGDRLVLQARMPHDQTMPITKEQLDKQQRTDIELIRKHFGAAGITVEI
jgi:hypothetical protein